MSVSAESAVAALRDEICGEFCHVCPSNCCSGRLNISVGGNVNFRDLPVVRSRWERPPASGAYVTDRRFLFFGGRYLVGRCPYLDDDGICGIHEKTDRPLDCSLFPLYLTRMPFSLYRVLKAEKSCFALSEPRVCRRIIELGQSLGVSVVFGE